MAVDIKLVEWSPEYDAHGQLDELDGAEIPVNHTISVADRRISIDDKTLIQNNVRTDTVTLDLDGEWDGVNVVIIIGNASGKVELNWSGSPIVIPAQVATGIGPIDVSVVGYSADGLTRLVTVYAPGAMTVVRSGDVVGEVPEEEFPSLTAQLMESANAANAAKDAALSAASAANGAASSATAAAGSANSAASSANTAASSANSAATKANSAAVDAQNAYDTLKPYMATIDSCANILHREVGPDAVVTADDAFPAKPVEMVVYGNTVQNLWVNPSGSVNGVTFTPNSDGSIAISGSPTGSNKRVDSEDIYVLKPNAQYTISIDRTLGTGSYVMLVGHDADGNQVPSDTLVVTLTGGETFETFTVPSGAVSCTCSMQVNSNGTASGTYRVMLNEGSTAEPWCPPGLNSVGQLRDDEKNLWVNPSGTSNGITIASNDDGSVSLSGKVSGGTTIISSGSIVMSPSTRYTASMDKSSGQATHGFSVVEYSSDGGKIAEHYFGQDTDQDLTTSFTTLSNCATAKCCFTALNGATVSGTYRAMLNEGSYAKTWVPPESESCVHVVTAGKNLAIVSNFVISASREVLVSTSIKKGTYTISFAGGTPDSNGSKLRIRYYDASGSGLQYIGGIPDSGKTHTFKHDVSRVYAYMDTDFEGESNISNFQLELGSTATDYEPPNVTTTPIDLKGHTLNALPDGTRDELHIDGGGNVVLEKRTGVATAPTDAGSWFWETAGDGIASFTLPAKSTGTQADMTELMRCDKLPIRQASGDASYAIVETSQGHAKNPAITSAATAATVAGGATYIYKLDEPQTIDLGTITPPTMAAPNVTAYVADDTPAEMSLDYVRDVNIVHARLEERVAALELASAT